MYGITPSLWLKSVELAVATPYVMSSRLTQFSGSGLQPSKADQREFNRMWTEKVSAFSEAWNAMFHEMLRQQQKLLLSPAHYWFNPMTMWQRTSTANEKIIGKGLAPIHRKAVANAHRLQRKQS